MRETQEPLLRPARLKTPARKPYSRQPKHKREQALAALAVSGSPGQAAASTGVPARTVYSWAQSPEGRRQLEHIRREHGLTLSSQIRSIVLAYVDLLERQVTGEERLTKSGDIVRVLPSARDAAVIIGILTDKERLLSQDALGSDEPIVSPDSIRSMDDLIHELTRIRDRKLAKAQDIEGEIVEQDQGLGQDRNVPPGPGGGDTSDHIPPNDKRGTELLTGWEPLRPVMGAVPKVKRPRKVRSDKGRKRGTGD